MSIIEEVLFDWPLTTRTALVELFGNFDKPLAKHTLQAYHTHLEGVPHADIETAIKRCIANPDQTYFPRIAEFRTYLPARTAGNKKAAWYDSYSGAWGGDWPTPGDDITPEGWDNLNTILEFEISIQDRQYKAHKYPDGTLPGWAADHHDGRQRFITFLKALMGLDQPELQGLEAVGS